MGLLPPDNVNSTTTLVAGSPLSAVPAGSTSTLQVTPGTGVIWPSGNFIVRLGSLLAHDTELVFVQTIAAPDTFTIQRGINGTIPSAWAIGTVCQQVTPVSEDTLFETVSSLVASTGGYSAMVPTVKASASSAALAASGTISTLGVTLARVTPGASCTGVILQQGTQDGQICIVENDSGANAITFAAAGTSFVADGVSDTIAALVSAIFTWNAGSALWYRIKAA